MNNEKKKMYEEINVEGVYHNIAALLTDVKDDDDNYNARLLMASFRTRQMHDQFLSNIQAGQVIWLNGRKLWFSGKNYVSKVMRCKDENKGDGYHALIYQNDEKVIRVYKNENPVNKVYEYIKTFKSGILDEWKEYFYNSLKDRGNIVECEGFDYTGGFAPKVLVVNDIDTTLIRTLKSYGLKNGKITLPVSKNEEVDPNMEFIDIINKLIIPFIESERCHYNVGEEISPIIKSPLLNNETKELGKLFPRQGVISQGLLNYFKEGHNYAILNGGMGVGKTYISSKLSYAIIKEHFKKENGRILLYCLESLMDKWVRELNDCLNPLGITPTVHKIRSIGDIRKLSKKPKGIEFILMPKDKVKRSYAIESVAKKREYPEIWDIGSYIDTLDIDKERLVEIKECNLRLIEMKVAALKYERLARKKVILYTKVLDKDGQVKKYRCVTTSTILRNLFITSNKAYHFEVDALEILEKLVEFNKDSILKEDIIDKESNAPKNHVICPTCGGKIYEKSAYIFDSEKISEYYIYPPEEKTLKLSLCNNYIKADGTPLSKSELNHIQKIKNYEIVENSVENPYVNEDGDALTGEELSKAKRGLNKFKILIRKCNAPMFGAKVSEELKGCRDTNLGKMFLKILGKKSVDIGIYDEAHQFSRQSNQGVTMGYLCKVSKINLLLTGTISGGKASDLYYLLWRIAPSKMVSMDYKYEDESLFIEHYGRRRKVTKEVEDNRYGKSGQTRTTSSGWNEIAGISPLMYNNFLTGCMVSRTIQDMKIPLPKLRYIKHELDMPDDLKKGYGDLKSDILRFMVQNKHIKLGGAYLNALLSYPNMPNQEDVCAEKGETFVARPTEIELEDRLLPKEEKLIETARKELAEGRRLLVYCTFTGKKGVSDRVVEVLKRYFKVAEMKASVALAKRETWIREKYNEGIEIIVCNPKLVETGLNIIQYPSIYFYEIPYSITTLRQAEKRAYRPSQKRECRIYYSYYKECIQEDAMKLVGGKKKASLALEGVFSNDILSSMGEGGQSLESMLNDVLKGKITLKEEELDAFGFEDEEVEYSFIENDNGNMDVTRTTSTTVEMSYEEAVKVSNLSIFEINEEFFKAKKSKKSKKAPVIGQYGFDLDI